MSRKLSIEEVREKIKKIHGDIVVLDETTYTNAVNTCRFLDKEHGEFWNKLIHVVNRKQGHPARRAQKTKETCLKKYGVESVLQLKEIRNKNKQLHALPVEEIKKRIKEIHGDIVVLDETTYVSTCIEARFIDKDYGEWWAKPNTVICQKSGHLKRKPQKTRETWMEKYGADIPFKNKEIKEKMKQIDYKAIKEKREDTLFKKYGVRHSQQVPEIALKTARSSNYCYILYHWKTNEELVCIGSYEKKVVEYLNKNKIEYKWQPNTFTLPDGRTYRPDLYLIEQNKWVEIKGYFRDDAKEKWEWFHSQCLNSELWNEEKLVEQKIL